MTGEIELLPQRALAGMIGHDAAGLAGREDATTHIARILRAGDAGLGAALRSAGTGALMNAKPHHFRRIRAKIAQARLSTGTGIIVGIGDSIMRGTSSEAGAAGGSSGILQQLATLLAGRGIPANPENVFGYGGYEQAFASFDSRVTVSGSFNQVAGGGIQSGGGRIFQASATGVLGYAPVAQVDTFDVYYLDNGATFSTSVDAASATTPAGLGNTSSIRKLTIAAGTLGAHAINIAWLSGTVYILGIVGYASAAKRIDLINLAWHGSRSQQWVDGAAGNSFWSFDRLVSFLGADLAVWGLSGTNDWGNSVPVTTFAANLATLVNKLKALSSPPDILLMTPPPSGSAAGSWSAQQDYIDAVIALAYDADLPVYDRWRSWGDVASMRSFGAINSDLLHPTRAGSAMDAERLLGFLLSR